MLIKCNECNHIISDSALNCVNCGAQVNETIMQKENRIDMERKKAYLWLILIVFVIYWLSDTFGF